MNDVKSNALAMWIEASRELVIVYRHYIVLMLVGATWYSGRETYWLLSNLNPQHIIALALTVVAIIAVLLLVNYERSRK